MILQKDLEIPMVILLIFFVIFLTLCICYKQSRSRQEEQGASNLAESEKKLTDAEVQIMVLMAPQIFEASYGIKNERKKRRIHKYCNKYLVKSPSSNFPNQKLPNQKLPNQKPPNQKLPNQKLPSQKLPSQKLPKQNVRELNKNPMLTMSSCSKIEIVHL